MCTPASYKNITVTLENCAPGIDPTFTYVEATTCGCRKIRGTAVHYGYRPDYFLPWEFITISSCPLSLKCFRCFIARSHHNAIETLSDWNVSMLLFNFFFVVAVFVNVVVIIIVIVIYYYYYYYYCHSYLGIKKPYPTLCMPVSSTKHLIRQTPAREWTASY